METKCCKKCWGLIVSMGLCRNINCECHQTTPERTYPSKNNPRNAFFNWCEQNFPVGPNGGYEALNEQLDILFRHREEEIVSMIEGARQLDELCDFNIGYNKAVDDLRARLAANNK